MFLCEPNKDVCTIDEKKLFVLIRNHIKNSMTCRG